MKPPITARDAAFLAFLGTFLVGLALVFIPAALILLGAGGATYLYVTEPATPHDTQTAATGGS
jgi:hypothetical protein